MPPSGQLSNAFLLNFAKALSVSGIDDAGTLQSYPRDSWESFTWPTSGTHVFPTAPVILPPDDIVDIVPMSMSLSAFASLSSSVFLPSVHSCNVSSSVCAGPKNTLENADGHLAPNPEVMAGSRDSAMGFSDVLMDKIASASSSLTASCTSTIIPMDAGSFTQGCACRETSIVTCAIAVLMLFVTTVDADRIHGSDAESLEDLRERPCNESIRRQEAPGHRSHRTSAPVVSLVTVSSPPASDTHPCSHTHLPLPTTILGQEEISKEDGPELSERFTPTATAEDCNFHLRNPEDSERCSTADVEVPVRVLRSSPLEPGPERAPTALPTA